MRFSIYGEARIGYVVGFLWNMVASVDGKIIWWLGKALNFISKLSNLHMLLLIFRKLLGIRLLSVVETGGLGFWVVTSILCQWCILLCLLLQLLSAPGAFGGL